MLKYLYVLRVLLVLLFTSTISVAATIIPQQIVIYKNPGATLPQQVKQKWLPPANAYTSITVPAEFDFLKEHGVSVARASAQIVWRANSSGSNTGAGIFLCPAQPNAGVELTGCSLLTYFAADNTGPASSTPGCISNPGGPMPCRADITQTLNSWIGLGTPGMYFVGVAFGNTVTGPEIWNIEMLINWQVP